MTEIAQLLMMNKYFEAENTRLRARVKELEEDLDVLADLRAPVATGVVPTPENAPPGTKLRVRSGQAVLTSFDEGQVVVLNFWDTADPGCPFVHVEGVADAGWYPHRFEIIKEETP